jgi:tryptophanyl-tRNA synthetase
MKDINELKTKLQANGIEFELKKLPGGTALTPEAHVAAMKDIGFGDTCATLVLAADGEVMALLRRGDTKINNKELRGALGASKIRFLTAEELKEKTGMLPGMVCPFLLPVGMKVFVDAKVLEKEQLYVGSGEAEHTLKVNTQDILKSTRAEKVSVSELDAARSTGQRFLSGVAPSSSKGLHLGNYLGAVKPHVEFQDKGECFYFIADYHALNSIHNPEDFRRNSYETFLDYLALGIDTDRTTFFIESHVSGIFELTEILNNSVTVSQMMRMHAFKDKMQDENAEHASINMGLFSYPILMAADILIFEPDVVPVGEDQQQHVEVCRDIGQSFNSRYGNVLKIPELYIKKEVARVPGTDGQRKMSKSLGNDLTIFADAEELKRQVMGIVTDPGRIHKGDPGDPAKNVIFTYMRLMDYDSAKLADFEARYREGSVGDVEIKQDFLQFFMDTFAKERAKRAELSAKPEYVRELITDGARRANLVAAPVLDKVRSAIGALRF